MNLCISNCAVGSMSRKTICKLSCHVSYWELFIRCTSIKMFSSNQGIVTHWNIYIFMTWSIFSRNSYLVEEKKWTSVVQANLWMAQETQDIHWDHSGQMCICTILCSKGAYIPLVSTQTLKVWGSYWNK